MEELKKEVEGTKEPKKLSYSELENVATNLSKQLDQAYMQLQQLNMGNTFKRLDYLFKVLDNKAVFSEEFFTKCKEEIELLMTIPEEEVEDSSEEAPKE